MVQGIERFDMNLKRTHDTFHLYIKAGDEPNSFTVTPHDPNASSSLILFLKDEQFDTTMLRLMARGADAVYRDIPSQNVATSYLGETLFKAFFPANGAISVRKAFTDFLAEHDPQIPQRIALHLPRSLYKLPWELLRMPGAPWGDFLSLFHSIIRIDGEAEGPDPRYFHLSPTDPTLQLLFLLSSPSNKYVGDFEPVDTGAVTFIHVDPATYDNFQAHTRKPDIRPDGFVFLGHGDVQGNYGALVFCKWQYFTGGRFRHTTCDPRPGFTIGSDLNRRSRLRFTCLLACESAWIDEKVTFEHSVVGAVMNGSKVPFVLGAQTPISLYACQEFLGGLVDALQIKEPLDFAITAGRQRVVSLNPELGIYPALDWWIPVLYSKTISFDLTTDEPQLSIPAGSGTF